MNNQLKQRIVMGSLGIIALIICIYYSFTPFFKPIFVLLIAGITSLALLEYYHLAQRKGFQPLVTFGICVTIAYTISIAFSTHYPALVGIPSLILVASLIIVFLIFFNRIPSSIGNLAITLFGIIYLTIPLGCILRINYFYASNALEDGRLWLAYVLIVSKMTDIGAYFCGKFFGKTKLAPLISPKKTVEGALGGSAAALIASVIFYLFFPTSHFNSIQLSFFQSIWIGLLISVLAQLGDLAESLLKRDAGVKDSNQLPGLGGILDVVDSLVFTLPFMYIVLKMHLVG